MIISSIAARSTNGVIGLRNALPWHLPDDLRYFQSVTRGHTVIMGRRNYESLPTAGPLPHRTNYVLTRQSNYPAHGCRIIHSLEEGISRSREDGEKELFIIGGAEVYAIAMPLTDKLYLTEIHAQIEGDRFFPTIDSDQWQEISRHPHPKDDRHAYAFDFVVLERKSPHHLVKRSVEN